jgi:hypothetical protein
MRGVPNEKSTDLLRKTAPYPKSHYPTVAGNIVAILFLYENEFITEALRNLH